MKDTPMAYYQDSAFSGYYVYDLNDDFIKFRYWCNGKYSRLCTYRIRYVKEGVQYFVSHHKRIYLYDFMRCGVL